MIKDTFFSGPRFINLCRKDMVESWKSNILRVVLLYGVMTIVMLWNGYFQYEHNYSYDPVWPFHLGIFIGGLWVFGCLSASFTMEKMKSKTNRISTLMTPATPFEKFFSRWLILIVVFLIVYFITYKLADYTRVLIYSLAYPEKTFIAPVDLSHLVGEETYYTLFNDCWELGAVIAGYFFVQSLFVLGSSVWPKNAFLKTFAAVTVIMIVYISVAAFLGNALLNDYYSPWQGDEMSQEFLFGTFIGICAFFTLLNWILAYFRFKESEIINRM